MESFGQAPHLQHRIQTSGRPGLRCRETLHALGKRHDLRRNLIRIWVAKYEVGAFEDDCPRRRSLAGAAAKMALGSRPRPGSATTSVIAGPVPLHRRRMPDGPATLHILTPSRTVIELGSGARQAERHLVCVIEILARDRAPAGSAPRRRRPPYAIRERPRRSRYIMRSQSQFALANLTLPDASGLSPRSTTP